MQFIQCIVPSNKKERNADTHSNTDESKILIWLSVQFSRSVMSNSVTPWTAAHQASLSITNSWSLPKLMSIKSVMPSNHPIFCHPLLLPSILPSIKVFPNESALCIRWAKYWSFSFSINPSKWDRVLRDGALGWPWGMGWGGMWERGSAWVTHVTHFSFM